MHSGAEIPLGRSSIDAIDAARRGHTMHRVRRPGTEVCRPARARFSLR